MTKQTLILAEKPSLGHAVATWLARTHGIHARPVGRTHVEVGSYIISWLFGHVLENFKPDEYDPRYKRWDYSDLPIIPEKWKLAPKSEAMAQIKVLKSLLGTVSEVIGFGDPDQEGQLLQDEFLLWARCKLPVKRLWLSATDDASIAKAWTAMKPNSHYEGYYWQALARSHADWLAGMNLSRACTLASKRNGGNALLSIGRVQTPTLALIVGREKAIERFKPVEYFTPYIVLDSNPKFKATWNPNKESDSRLDPEGRLLSKPEASKIAAACSKEARATVTSVKATKGKEQPPLPFSLSSLQEHMSKRFGMGVQDVLKHAQSLYEKKIATYPRTDSEYLPESQHGEAREIVSRLKSEVSGELGGAAAKAQISLKSKAWNDKKVTAHHAIVPRPVIASQISALSVPERQLWLEIAKRYLLQFFPAAEFLSTEIELICAGEPFRATGKVYTLLGWKEASGSEKKEDDPQLPTVSKGQTLTVCEAQVDSTTTKPPKRFTEGTLVAAMKSVHRYVIDPKLKAILRENVGIGTEATRANVIGDLFGRSFIKLQKKEILPTELGTQLIDTLPAQLTAPDMTALWQQAMDDIRTTAEPGYKAFIEAQAKWLEDLVKEVPAWFAGKSLSTAGAAGKKGTKKTSDSSVVVESSTHKCPSCSGELKHIKGKFGWFFGCQNPDCKAVFKDVDGKPVVKSAAPSAILTLGGISTGDKCPKCKKGTMQARTCGPHTKTPGKQFLACSNFFSKGRAKCDHTIWS